MCFVSYAHRVSVLQFASATIGQLAWPVMVIFIIWILKGPIETLLTSPRLTSIKAGLHGLELALDRGLDEAKKSLAEHSKPLTGTDSPPDPQEGEENFLVKMFKLADVSPRSVIMESFSYLEWQLRNAVSKKSRGSQLVSSLNTRQLTREAVSENLISRRQASAIEELVYLRDRVVHGPEEDLSSERALKYAAVAFNLMNVIRDGES